VSGHASTAIDVLRKLEPAHLAALAGALEGGTLSPPYSTPSIGRFVPQGYDVPLTASLAELQVGGMSPSNLALLLRVLVAERQRAEEIADRVSLVWTGPELPGSETRDTSVVVRGLFERAQQRAYVSGFVVHGGKAVFAPLAERLDENPELDVRLFLNVARPEGDEREAVHVLRDYAAQFATYHWPGKRVPRLFHDPRSLRLNPAERAVLHAKCVVIDDEVAFVSSANLTGAAQFRNVEAGVMIEDSIFARRLRNQFDVLVEHKVLQPVAWPTG
jgi:hypothetical protein